MTNYQHQSLSHQHFTPKIFVEAIRSVMGSIDLDPCTSEAVNDWSVKAELIFTEDPEQFFPDGLTHLYSFRSPRAKVFCNPPGGKRGNQSNLRLWFEAIHDLWLAGWIEQCFFLAFNQELLGSCHKELRHIPRFHCPRIKYWSFDDEQQCFREGNRNSKGIWTNSPTQMSTLLYLPPRTNAGWTEQVGKLDDAFNHIDGSWVIPQMPTDLGAKQ